MKTQMKAMARPYVTLFGMALIVAVVARIGLGIMDATGALAYDYISASDVAILDTICSILTGSAFVAFMFAASLALTLSVAGVVLYAAIARREGGQARNFPARACSWLPQSYSPHFLERCLVQRLWLPWRACDARKRRSVPA